MTTNDPGCQNMNAEWIAQVCNHPDLFEGRPIVSAFDMWGMEQRMPSTVLRSLEGGPLGAASKLQPGLRVTSHEGTTQWASRETRVRTGNAKCRFTGTFDRLPD